MTKKVAKKEEESCTVCGKVTTQFTTQDGEYYFRCCGECQ